MLRGEAAADVPCDGCTVCCESSQFVLVERDVADARAAIPLSSCSLRQGRRRAPR